MPYLLGHPVSPGLAINRCHYIALVCLAGLVLQYVT
jgi:hypothetical protein